VRSNKLASIMMVLLVISIFISLFSFYTLYRNKDELLQSIQRNVELQLAQYDIPTTDDLKIDEARILLAVAKYCATRNDCSGQDGYNGPQGVPGLTGVQGVQGLMGIPGRDGVDGSDGYTPVKGVDYFDGETGANGNDGREIEQHCNPDANRVEWRYVGDENWTPLYNLSPAQTCATEEVEE